MTAGGWITIIVVGLIVGWIIKEYGTKKEYPGGIWVALLAGLVGAWLGDLVLGDWGWMLGGANVIAAIIGAAVIAWIVSLFGKEEKKEA
ncbi:MULTISPECIES: GlsB/YeaQ/YmgE family stress response membrane protein [Limnochorda]|uniref:GlsB/YeaQ/YmgE family stress response membrane protein n=1 Tax=Limnochorda TaxID=1676651 RepID=UPI0017AB9A34|nr:GlsB/YeaQ/YmgE family stress response membrane protein [Limnochorda pilosa]MBO2486810.1 hypothetical protein [Bacillota bacterium]MBO2519322.1 hypothetical protein [Bacillota bacterium]NMA71139.1 GlsB/YeaQ/YmgE family stress response membrane protein [Bacillota bacterium]